MDVLNVNVMCFKMSQKIVQTFLRLGTEVPDLTAVKSNFIRRELASGRNCVQG